jgi:hypothetical protein
MAISDIVALGFGNGTFDPGVNKLPTLGYGIGELVFDDDNSIYRPGRVGRTSAYRPPVQPSSGLYRPDRQGK